MEKIMQNGNKHVGLSRLRKEYTAKLIIRCVIWIGCIILCLVHPDTFSVLEKGNFFRKFSILHVLWLIWVLDMIQQLVPVKKHIALGSQKLFPQRFKPVREKVNLQSLKKYIVSTTKAAYKVFILWAVVVAAIGALYLCGVIDRMFLFMFTVFFYVCDLICVLVWCPFRLMMKNKCCTTCRIFNWDHLMMFSPLVFMGGFFSVSLFVLSLLVWCLWEACVLIFPERFWEFSNEALKCSNCTDKLCIQYCQKLRKRGI